MREVKTVPEGDEDRGRDSYTLHSGKLRLVIPIKVTPSPSNADG